MKILSTFILFLFMALPITAKKKLAIIASGENLATLTQVTDSKFPCITPTGGEDGKNLFYAVNEDGKYYNIYKKDNAFSNATTQKTFGRNFNVSPSYNRLLDKIAFRCFNEGMSTSEIYVTPNTKGKALTQITETDNAFEGNPCFSDDGKYIVYDRKQYGTIKEYSALRWILGLEQKYTILEKSEIWRKNVETGENTLLCSGYQPQFSPDGKHIAYVKYSADEKSCSIWIMNFDGTQPVQVTDSKKGYAFYPRWSPKGDKIVFQLTRKDKKDADIYVIDIDGNNLTQLTINKSHDGTPYWTRDGYLYFVSDRGNVPGNYQIWRCKLDE